jgi:hypothetical protein
MSNRRKAIRLTAGGLAAVLLSLPALPLAQESRPAVSRSSSKTAAVVSTGTILGTAWRGDSTPYPQARIRLRNVQNGRGIGRTVSDVDGRFRFERVDQGAYVVELLSQDDKVLAVGDLFGVSAGQQSLTAVRLSSRAPWFSGFFGNAAAAAIAAASTLGVTATGSNGRPASAQ